MLYFDRRIQKLSDVSIFIYKTSLKTRDERASSFAAYLSYSEARFDVPSRQTEGDTVDCKLLKNNEFLTYWAFTIVLLFVIVECDRLT